MANPEHVEILKQGVEVWNRWREDNSNTEPDLSKMDFSFDDLNGIMFFDTDLSNTILDYTLLSKADLARAKLLGANLFKTNLTNAYLYRSNLNGADCSYVDSYKCRIFFSGSNDSPRVQAT